MTQFPICQNHSVIVLAFRPWCPQAVKFHLLLQMFLSKVLPLALIVAVSHADVIRNSQSPTLRHDPPTPSTYPLNEPCVPEWQYLNFNPDDANDKTRLEKLHHVLCSGELRAVWNYRKLSARDLLIPYKHYFPSSEEVYDFFQTPIQEIEALVGTFVVDNFGRFYICAVIFFLSLHFFFGVLFDLFR